MSECTDDGALFMYSVSCVLLRRDGYTIFVLRVTCGFELEHVIFVLLVPCTEVFANIFLYR